MVFIGEFLYFLYFLPGWIRKHAKEARSRFWTEQVALGKAPRASDCDAARNLWITV